MLLACLYSASYESFRTCPSAASLSLGPLPMCVVQRMLVSSLCTGAAAHAAPLQGTFSAHHVLISAFSVHWSLSHLPKLERTNADWTFTIVFLACTLLLGVQVYHR